MTRRNLEEEKELEREDAERTRRNARRNKKKSWSTRTLRAKRNQLLQFPKEPLQQQEIQPFSGIAEELHRGSERAELASGAP